MQTILRILLVEDKPAVLLTYRLILQQQGHCVTAAPCYSEAVEQLNAREFDVLLCDLGLDGDRNGFDVIEHARVKAPQIRPVLLTGFADEAVAKQAADRGVTVLFKPVAVPELLATVVGADMNLVKAIA